MAAAASCKCPAPRVDVPVDETKTSDLYQTINLPQRFDKPCMFIFCNIFNCDY